MPKPSPRRAADSTGTVVTAVSVPERRRHRGLFAACLGAIVASNVFLFAPATLYLGNPDEFTAPLSSIALFYGLPALALAVVTAAAGLLLSAHGYSRLVAFLAAISVLLWVQGNVLVWDYGPLDGSPIPWLANGWRGAVDTTLWVGLILVGLYGYTRFGKLIVNAALVTFAIQAFALGAALVTTERPVLADEVVVYDEAQYRAMYGFSREQNVLHVVMDGFQSDIFADILQDPENRGLVESLSGFTFFDKHVGTFPYTHMTVPLIVSGKTYLNEVPIDEFTDAAMQGESILNLAAASGFEIDIATQVALRKIYDRGSVTNAYDIPASRHATARDYIVSDAARLADYSLFRLTPHFVKAYIYQDELWFVQRWVRDADYMSIRYFSELQFLEEISAGLNADRDKPVYKLFHLMLSHRPTVGNEQCEYDGIRKTWRTNVTVQARCGLSRVAGLLNAMKELGVYDNTLVILMADHGAWIPARGYEIEQGDVPGEGGGPTPTMAGMALPVLAIKPPGSNGPIAVSSAPTTIADVPATVASIMGFESGFEGWNVFEPPAGTTRTRVFFDYAYGKNARHPGYLHVMAEYAIDGDPFDYESWRLRGRRLPEGETETLHPVGAGL